MTKTILKGDGSWPFDAYTDGEDICVDNVVITAFGGYGNGHISDPQDNGDTASGVSTKDKVIEGVSLAMDGRAFKHLSSKEHKALDGSPIPRMPFHTKVQVTIGGETFLFKDGVVDLGPGKQASKPGEPHALDLTVPAAARVSPHIPLNKLATMFSKRGSFRILGGVKFLA